MEGLSVAVIGSALEFYCLGFGSERSFFACAGFFLPCFFRAPISCSEEELGFCFFSFALAWSALARCEGNPALLGNHPHS